ncbi:MAG: glycosyl hydrolase family 8 [Bacillota bacterium]|nr:glycosyl hydrolase family 8 [Bacillota bacterium]
MIKYVISSLIIIFTVAISFCANFPFPQNKVFYGIKVTGDMSERIESVYKSWLSQYYEEQDTLARITWDNQSQTASEGIGYGMLIMVCMDNAENNTRPKFDKLWAYYKKFRDSNGLMNWKIDGFSGIASDGQTGATDADLDVAAALILAYRQWGDQKYRNDAQELISAIRRYEISDDFYIKPGDAWDDKRDPSYFSVGALELFKSVDTSNYNWSHVISNCFDIIKKTRDTATGLPPDWYSSVGDTVLGDFGYEAVRVPWRMAWAYSWYGIHEAAEINGKITNWIRKATEDDPSSIKSEYTLLGSPQGSPNAAYAGALTCGGMTSSENQNWIDSGFHVTENALSNCYYFKTLQVLFMMLLSGNFPLMTNSPEAINQYTPAVSVKRFSPKVSLSITGLDRQHFNRGGYYFMLNGKRMKNCSFFTAEPLIVKQIKFKN